LIEVKIKPLGDTQLMQDITRWIQLVTPTNGRDLRQYAESLADSNI